MAFPISEIGGYGTGKLGTVKDEVADKQINSYVHVTAITATTITIDSANDYTGAYETFSQGACVLFHVSAMVGDDTDDLGKYAVGEITKVEDNVLTVDFDPTKTITLDDFAKYHCQLLAVPQFRNLTLNAGITAKPIPYSASNKYGGIVAFKCANALTFNGGHINLTDCGIPVNSTALRPLSAQEQDGILDIDTYSGWENAQTKDRLLLNAGDGAAFIVAKKVVCHADSRIGNPVTKGVQFYRGATDSRAYNETAPENVTNIGGSTILIAAETITDFTPALIAKYRSSTAAAGQGIARCYIATETVLRNDEGLYAYDCLSNPARLTEKMNISSFGDGSLDAGEGLTTQLNNYATVTAINGAKISYANKTTAGLAKIERGALVMIHANHKSTAAVKYSGRFFLATVWSDDGATLTLNTSPSKFFSGISTTDYAVQVVSIPQFTSFKLAATNAATPKFNGSQGGIFAVAVSGTCDLRNGKINVEGKGGGKAYGREGLRFIGNAQDCDRLPIGQGHGSVFILAKNLTLNSGARIGATYSGAVSIFYNGTVTTKYGGVGGLHDDWGGGYSGKGSLANTSGWGGDSGRGSGGYGANGDDTDNSAGGAQGAHIMIVADKITGFNQSAISTGGEGGRTVTYIGGNGSAGYGGGGGLNTGTGGGYNGGGRGSANGGSAGWAFIYCNTATSQITTDTVLFD